MGSMSRSEEYSYALAAQLRQQVYNQRVSETTATFLRRYQDRYQQMVDKGFKDYIPNEMSRLKSDLDQISALLFVNPSEARDISRDVGSFIGSIDSLGYTAKKQFDLQERVNQQKVQEEISTNKSEILKYFYSCLQSIKDPVVRDFAKDEVEKLKNSVISQNGKTDEDLPKLKASIDGKIFEITNIAVVKAEEWKQRRLEEHQKQSYIEQLDSVEEDLKKEKIEDKKEIDKLMASIADIRKSLQGDSSSNAAVITAIKEVSEGIDKVVISETTRREAVKAIIQSLKAQEFTVGKPEIVNSGNGNYVKIVAKKPSGSKAECRIDLSGKIKYKFDEYEGMSCLKDIKKFNVDLDEIYSIKLSDQRILWENPIRQTKDTKPIDNSNTRRNG